MTPEETRTYLMSMRRGCMQKLSEEHVPGIVDGGEAAYWNKRHNMLAAACKKLDRLSDDGP